MNISYTKGYLTKDCIKRVIDQCFLKYYIKLQFFVNGTLSNVLEDSILKIV